MSSRSLPADVIFDILCKLPVKSLLRFKCVCKSWLALISDPLFIKQHLNRVLENITIPNDDGGSSNFIVISAGIVFHVDNGSETETNDGSSRKLDLPFQNSIRSPWVAGSCNGLVCLADERLDDTPEDLFVWNPSTGDYVKLPETPFERPPSSHLLMTDISAFGYISALDEYKVVKVIDAFDVSRSPGVNRSTVLVHTLGTDSWRKIGEDVSFQIDCRSGGLLLHGGIHWPAARFFQVGVLMLIVCFDLEDEVFWEVPSPDMGEVDKDWIKLGVLRGCLCAFLSVHGERIDIWVMEDYGAKESWIRQFSFQWRAIARGFESYDPAWFVRDGEIFLKNASGEVVLYHPIRNRVLRLPNARDREFREGEFKRILGYVQTLVSPLSLKANSGVSRLYLNVVSNLGDNLGSVLTRVWRKPLLEKIIVAFGGALISYKKLNLKAVELRIAGTKPEDIPRSFDLLTEGLWIRV
ncbi:PREDICTED: F-box protein At3g07870-like [Nelumbo nucifera]|uniref:F-box protein At3g07870-like n=1 Tax=Nelumbo nucifera TaxID=4432 RepID=A0A1U7ZJH9_NELNU|nr:PREDICTED: F-box protein At3g07870-like [Nelumbo nucifera]